MTKKLTYLALLCAMSIILGYIETFIPFNLGIPGTKLGLANLITMTVLFVYGFKAALLVSLLRVFIIALVFTNLYMFLYSFSGAIVSLLIMTGLKKFNFSIIIISISGAIFHNLGQLVIALIFLGFNISYYLPYLIIIACLTGTLIGLIAQLLISKFPKQLRS